MFHRRSALLAVGACLILLGGCDEVRDVLELPLDQPQSSVVEKDGIRLTLETDRRGYELGQTVFMTLTAENTSEERQVLSFANSCQHKFYVRRRADLVWSYNPFDACLESPTTVPLEPDETWTWSEDWDQLSNNGMPVDAGDYDVSAELLLGNLPEPDSLTVLIR